MKINDLKQQQKEKYIEKNKLQNSYIEKEALWQCRPLLPVVKTVGCDDENNLIIFEETAGSLKNRHYGKTNKATSFNLLFCNGEKSEKITIDYLNNNKIHFYDGYDKSTLIDFLKRNNKRFNGLNETRKPCQFKLTTKEHEIVKKFIKKMRAFNENENF